MNFWNLIGLPSRKQIQNLQAACEKMSEENAALLAENKRLSMLCIENCETSSESLTTMMSTIKTELLTQMQQTGMSGTDMVVRQITQEAATCRTAFEQENTNLKTLIEKVQCNLSKSFIKKLDEIKIEISTQIQQTGKSDADRVIKAMDHAAASCRMRTEDEGTAIKKQMADMQKKQDYKINRDMSLIIETLHLLLTNAVLDEISNQTARKHKKQSR